MTSFLRWMTLIVVVGAALGASATDPTAVAKRLHSAAQSSSLDDPALKPWQLKLSFQLYDAKGKPTEQGTLEEWWTETADKRIYTSPSYTSTDIMVGKTLYRTTSQPSPPYMLELLRDQVVHPISRESAIDGSVPDLRTEPFGKVKLDCIMLDQPIKNVAYPPLGLFPTYCLDIGTDRLRVSYNFGSESITRNTMGSFQGRSIAIDTRVNIGKVVAATAHVDRLSGFAPDAQSFSQTNGLSEQNMAVSKVPAAVIAGAILYKAVPVYPEEAKEKHLSGTVVLRALIGTDGHIHGLQVLSAPDASLAISAVAAVRQWMYKPYLINGLPTSVDTTITVNYNFGPG